MLRTQGGGSEYEEVKCLLTWPYAKMLQVTIIIENDNPAKLKVKSYAVAVTDARRCSPFDNAFLFYIM